MKINNFDLIRELLTFDNEDEFYFVEILQRKKDDSSLSVNNRLIKAYAINSLETFDKLKDEMIKISKVTNSRIYINLNRRSFKTITLQTLKACADYISDNNYSGIIKLVHSMCGKFRSEQNPTWIIDADNDLLMSDKDLIEMLYYIENSCEPIGSKFLKTIPTVNGKHFIVKPFNLQKFKLKYPNIDVHKNNPTLLYYDNN